MNENNNNNMVLNQGVYQEQGASIPQIIPAKPEMVIDKPDIYLAVAMFVIAFIGVDSFNIMANHARYGIGVTIYVLLYGISVLIYAKAHKTKIGMGSIFWMAVMLMSASSYIWVYQSSLIIFNAFFLRLVMVYYTADILGALICGKTSGFLILDAINILFVIPCYNYVAQWMALGKIQKKNSVLLSLAKSAVGALVAVPLIFIILALLSMADENFCNMVEDFIDNIGADIWSYIWSAILAVPVGAYLYGLIYGAAHKRYTDTWKKKDNNDGSVLTAVIPRASIYTVMAIICIIYVLFIALQGSYFMDAIRGVLPESFTYSEYARRGFFELVIICVINAGIVGFAELFCRRIKTGEVYKKGITLKVLDGILALLTILIIVTALVKMNMYMQAYGLTPLRVIPTLFMLWLGLIYICVILKQFIKVPIIRIGLCSFALGYALLSISNMDGMIAKYDIMRAQNEGIKEYEDVLNECSLAAVPYIYEAFSSADVEEKKQYRDIVDRLSQGNAYEDAQTMDRLQDYNYSRNASVDMINEMKNYY